MNPYQVYQHGSGLLTDNAKLAIKNIFKSHLTSKFFGPPWPETGYISSEIYSSLITGIPAPDDPCPWPWPWGPLVRDLFIRELVRDEVLDINHDIFNSVRKEGFLLDEIESMQKSTLALQKTLNNLKKQLS